MLAKMFARKTCLGLLIFNWGNSYHKYKVFQKSYLIFFATLLVRGSSQYVGYFYVFFLLGITLLYQCSYNTIEYQFDKNNELNQSLTSLNSHSHDRKLLLDGISSSSPLLECFAQWKPSPNIINNNWHILYGLGDLTLNKHISLFMHGWWNGFQIFIQK